jgi:hypothetical protein
MPLPLQRCLGFEKNKRVKLQGRSRVASMYVLDRHQNKESPRTAGDDTLSLPPCGHDPDGFLEVCDPPLVTTTDQ